MVLVEKCINHASWILNALKEHNKIIKQDIKMKMTEKAFLINQNFQKFYYAFSLYYKLIQNVEKGYALILKIGKVNKTNIQNIHITYLNRAALHFKEAGNYLKKSRQEIVLPSNQFSLIYIEMKQIAMLLQNLERDFLFLKENLY